MFKKILAPTDGSALAVKGVRKAGELAKALGAGLIVLSVEEPYSYANVTAYRPESSEQHADRVRAETEERRESAAKALEGLGVAYEFMSASGASTADAILGVQREQNCDLICIASHGRSGISAVLLGSVSKAVLANSGVPVLVCH